ncbi:DUF5372 family protein [Alicyclobacillus sp. SO9]|uniref:DUF5372 family protein n=1 Tax=Alicyclobacillus sp. SO9 TaxID=2665646 RepID=UPI0018E86407|nr:hypothetical protein GI364_19160 [Alicyclobacillus sp. SO9]QQE78359.1 hypothetical protein GI364_21190 [Alicyclobacillus sp. SO9]QQE78837.1 hypothetical protein GI364_23845 [Alicyclobacillus sp. SO9]
MQNALQPNSLSESVTITHPFHPLHGQTFTLLKIKHVNGIPLYSLQTDSSVICVPESWTDRHRPQDTKPVTPFNGLDLKELVELLRSLDDSSVSTANLIDNSK